MARRVVAAVLVLCLLSFPVWADEDDKASPQTTLGVGGVFFTGIMGGTPGFDVFAQFPLGDVLAARANLTMLLAVQGVYLVLVEGTGILRFGGEGFTPYVGAGAGLFMVLATAIGQAQALITFNMVGGAELPLGDQFGVFGQVRLMGVMDPPLIDMFFGPSVGIYIRF